MDDFALTASSQRVDDPFHVHTGLVRGKYGEHDRLEGAPRNYFILPSYHDRIKDVVGKVPKFRSPWHFLLSEGMHGLNKWAEKLASDGTGFVDLTVLNYIADEMTRDRELDDLRDAITRLKIRWHHCKANERPALRRLASDFLDKLAGFGYDDADLRYNIVNQQLYVANADS